MMYRSHGNHGCDPSIDPLHVDLVHIDRDFIHRSLSGHKLVRLPNNRSTLEDPCVI